MLCLAAPRVEEMDGTGDRVQGRQPLRSGPVLQRLLGGEEHGQRWLSGLPTSGRKPVAWRVTLLSVLTAYES